MSVLISGGTVVTPRGSTRASVRIDGETIAEIGDLAPLPGEAVVDAAGCLVLPGGIDSHTHLELDCGPGLITADTWATGTRSALAGGTTMMVDFATQFHGQSLGEGLAAWHGLADGHAVSDYAFHMAFTEWKPEFVDELPDMVAAGITSFKMYMGYYGSMMVNDDQILQALRAAREAGVTFGFHCENGTLIAARVAEELAAGHTASWYHQRTRPEGSEWEAAYRLGFIAETADAPVYVVHVSSAGTLDVVKDYRTRGVRYTAETCPQYLVADNSEYGPEPVGGVASSADEKHARQFMMSPPLRDASNNDRLWKLLADGDIQFVGTDHCSFTLAQKDMGREDFTKIPGGLPGVETRGEVVYTRGVAAGRMTVAGMCRALCENPAKLYGLYPRKGVIAAGSDADIVVYDPRASHILTARDMVTKAGYTPFEGLRTEGGIAKVYLRGSLMVEDGRIVGGPEGQYLRRGLCTL